MRRLGHAARRRARLGAVAISLALLGCDAAAAPEGSTVTIRDRAVHVEVARTRAEQARGLSQRPSLDWHRGMLFVYEEPGFPTFWMKAMRFDIDIVWIRDGRIVGVSAFVPYPREDPDQPATRRSPELTDTVLEVPAGYARAHGWRRGDLVRVDLAGGASP